MHRYLASDKTIAIILFIVLLGLSLILFGQNLRISKQTSEAIVSGSFIKLDPNPITVCLEAVGKTTVKASAPVDFEVRAGDPAGALVLAAAANSVNSQETGQWVTDGQIFFLLDTASREVLGQVAATFTLDGCPPAPAPIVTAPYKDIKSATWYEFGPSYTQTLANLQKALPAIKRNGFNTVWLVTPWGDLNPKPLAKTPTYNKTAFTALRKTLDALKQNGMKAFLGLNYLGQGWSPEGIDPCTWTTNDTMYKAFETYVMKVMKGLEGYEDTVYLLVFTEGAEPCNLNPYGDAVKIAELLQTRLGSLPARLPAALRQKFKIGYHDYSLINLGWAGGISPIRLPNSFDFVSMVAYGMEGYTDVKIASELERRSYRFRYLHPTSPLVVGELGADSCNNQQTNQARVVSKLVSYGLEKGHGFNVWAWKPPSSEECSAPSLAGLAITNLDGTRRPAAEALAKLFGL